VKHDVDLARRASPISAAGAFSRYARDVFAECYPGTPHKFRHSLHDHPLLALDALAELGERLPPSSVACAHKGTTSVSDAIRASGAAEGLTILGNIEQEPAYSDLMLALLGELKPEIERRTGRIATACASILISGQGSTSPYRFDPDHRLMLQLSGSKMLTQFPAGDPQFASDEAHEACHVSGICDLQWRDDFAQAAMEWQLEPGDAVYVPAMAPHQVVIGSKPAISLAIGWRSAWSLEEADARAFNAQLRRLGIRPMPPERWPAGNRRKALAWRAWRKFLQRR